MNEGSGKYKELEEKKKKSRKTIFQWREQNII